MKYSKKLFLVLTLCVTIFSLVGGSLAVTAQNTVTNASLEKNVAYDGPPDAQGMTSGGVESQCVPGEPKFSYKTEINGGYVASGVGMRHRGWGTILIKDIPAGSTVVAAFLFWSIIGPSGVTVPPADYAKGIVNGKIIKNGRLMGSANQPCWAGGLIFGYKADITGWVQALGNGVYRLQNFASADIWGNDPWNIYTYNYPKIEGASLVVVYSNPGSPLTNIQIQGTVTDILNSSITFSGFTASNTPNAKTTFIVSDGQSNATETVNFNGNLLPFPIDGRDRQDGIPFSNGQLQDTITHDVSALVQPGDTSATANIIRTGDCLTWLAQVFAIN